MKPKQQYNIGDRVKVVCLTEGNEIVNDIIIGDTGTVKFLNGILFALVEFDKDIRGHSGGGLGKQRHCWWMHTEDIMKINNNE